MAALTAFKLLGMLFFPLLLLVGIDLVGVSTADDSSSCFGSVGGGDEVFLSSSVIGVVSSFLKLSVAGVSSLIRLFFLKIPRVEFEITEWQKTNEPF